MSDTPTYDQLSALCAQMAAALEKLDRDIFHDPQEIERAGQFRETIESALTAYRTRSPDLVWQRVPEGWRDMDSAPKTGCQVLLYGHWKQFHGTKDESNHVNCGHYANGWVCEGRYNEDFIAVAWQPMPSPPILNRARGEG